MFVEFTHPDGTGTKILVAKNAISFVTEHSTVKTSIVLKSGESYKVQESYKEVKALLLPEEVHAN